MATPNETRQLEAMLTGLVDRQRPSTAELVADASVIIERGRAHPGTYVLATDLTNGLEYGHVALDHLARAGILEYDETSDEMVSDSRFRLNETTLDAYLAKDQ